MRIVAHVVVSYLLLVMLGSIWRITPFEIVAPDLALIVAVYLGITARSYMSEAVAGVVAMAWISDVLSGAPRGLSSVVLGVVCILCRLASTRLLLRGRLFIATFCFVASIGATLLVLGLRAYFGARLGALWDEVLILFGSAFLTALLAPLVFRLLRSIDARFARTEREREAVKEGYLS